MASHINVNVSGGLQYQPTLGTAVAPGANDKIFLLGSIPLDQKMDPLPTGGAQVVALRPTKQDVMFSANKPYWEGAGIVELLLYNLFGACTAGPLVALYADGRVGYDIEFTLAAQPDSFLTYAATLDSGPTDLVELEGLKTKAIEFSFSGQGLLTASVEFIGNAMHNSDSSDITTEGSDINALTVRCELMSVTGPYDYKGIIDRFWLAAQNDATFSSADKICVTAGSIRIERPYEEQVFPTCSAGWERKLVSPDNVTLKFTLADWNSWQWHTWYKNGTRLKAKLDWHNDFGGVGPSISAGSPSTDISAHASPGTFKLKLKREYADGSFEYVSGKTTPHVVSVVTAGLNTGNLIATALQAAIRLLTSDDPDYQDAFTTTVVDYNTTNTGKYTLRPTITDARRLSFVVTDGASNDIAVELGLGTGNGGTEPGSCPQQLCFYFPDLQIVGLSDTVIGETGRIPMEVTCQALGSEHGTVVGFRTSDDARLLTDMTGGEACRVVVVQQDHTSIPSGW